jgi:hypothetical protein
MGRAYAVVMGSLAFSTVVLRCVLRSSAVEATVGQAVICLFVFAAIGAAIGQLAGWIVDDSVRTRLADEIAASAIANNKVAVSGTVKKS